MNTTKTRRMVRLEEKRPPYATLRSLGVGVEHFPRYQEIGDMHLHEFVEMNVIVSGRGRQRIEDQWYEMQRGRLSVIHYDQAHAMIGDARGLEIINVYLDPGVFPLPNLPDRLRRVLPMIVPLHREFRHQRNRLISFALQDPETPIALLRILERELRCRPVGYRQAVRHYMALFFIECCRQYLSAGGSETATEISISPGVERLRRHLNTHFMEAVTLDALADLAGYSPAHLCRMFKRCTGRSVFDYIKQRRIERAMVLLRSTREKVLAVAFESGFGDVSHFNRTFRKMVGVSPGVYRKKWHTEE